MSPRFGVVLRSAVVALAAYFAALGVERLFIRLLSASTGELLWVSDLVLAVVVGSVSYLWINLRASRTTVSRLEREQIVLNTQLAVAADIQRRALPPVPAPGGGIEWAAELEPAGKIGGDFYDFVRADDDVVLALVGDISGKGIPAALLLALARAVFRTSARQTRDPAEIVARLSRALYDDTEGSPYATCMVLAVHLGARTLTCASAGHPPALIVGASGRRLLEPSGPPAGMFPSWSASSTRILLQPGDVGVLMTDGVTEALENADDGPALDAIERVVRRLGTAGAGRTCHAIMQLAREGHGPKDVEGWQDDRTVMVFRVAP